MILTLAFAFLISQSHAGPLPRKPAQDVAGANSAYDLELFLNDQKSELEKSERKVSVQRAEKTAKTNFLLSNSYDPFSIVLGTKSSQFTFDPVVREDTLKASMLYRRPEGLAFELSGEKLQSTNAAVLSRVTDANYGFRVSQELIKGLSGSKIFLQRELVQLEGRANIADAENQYLSSLLALMQDSANLFAAHCKRIEMSKLLNLTHETVNVSNVQLRAKTIHTREHLRIVDTFLNLQRQLKEFENSIRQYENKFESVSRDTRENARKLGNRSLVCSAPNDIQATAVPTREALLEMVKAHPINLELELQKSQVKKRYDVFQVERKPSFEVYGGHAQGHVVSSNYTYAESFIGVTFTYQFKGEENQFQKTALLEQNSNIINRQKNAQADLISYLTHLAQEVEAGTAMIPIIRKQSENAGLLLKIIRTQEQIGQLDATAIDNAYISYSQALVAQMDVWTSVYISARKLSEIKKAISRVGTSTSF